MYGHHNSDSELQFCSLTTFFLYLQKNDWLCLNCQTQRLLEGSLGDVPPPLLPPSKQGSPRHQPGVTPTASPKHLPGAISTGSPRHQPAPTVTASPLHQKTGPTASPQHQVGMASQQKPVTGHLPESIQDKRVSQLSQLKGSEPVKTQPRTEEKKAPEDTLQHRTPADSQKVSKQTVPKSKSVSSKKEVISRNGKSLSEIQKVKDQEVRLSHLKPMLLSCDLLHI